MRHVVLYIPGLGDHYDDGRSFLLKGWRLWGIKTRLIPIKWYDKGSYQDKLALVRAAIKTAKKQGYLVTLIGESAGASLALNAAGELPGDIEKVIVIAGVNSSQLPLSPQYKALAPAFVESAKRVSRAIETINRTKIHTVRALRDSVVSPRYNDIPNAHRHVIPTIGHFTVIILCLSILSGFITWLVRRKD